MEKNHVNCSGSKNEMVSLCTSVENLKVCEFVRLLNRIVPTSGDCNTGLKIFLVKINQEEGAS